MPGDCFPTCPHACKAELLQTHHEAKILHILLHDDIVKKDQMFSIKTDVMLPHYMRGEEVTAPEDWSGDKRSLGSALTERGTNRGKVFKLGDIPCQ